MADVARLILTASGGPFRNLPAERLVSVTPADALAHPDWRMGAKVTIDSATLMNKGLEVIEAHWLFDCDYDRTSTSWCIRRASSIRPSSSSTARSRRSSGSPTCASPSSTP